MQQQVENFKYFGMIIWANGRVDKKHKPQCNRNTNLYKVSKTFLAEADNNGNI